MTTSGLAFRILGCVGDSTVRGNAVFLTNGAHRIVRYMADGKSPTDACLEALRDVVRFTKVKRLLRADGKPDFQVKFYGVNKRGETGGAALYESRHAICDDRGPRLVDSAVLFT